MWSDDKIMDYLKENLKESRLKHSLGVKDTAVKLAKIYHEDVEKARIAGLVHDCAKYMKNEDMLNIAEKSGYNINEVCLKNPSLLHGVAGSYVAKNIMEIDDEYILNAITYHTTGRRNMTLLEKIIFMADYIEPSRDFPGVEDVRKLAYEDIDKALLKSLDKTIAYVIKEGQLLHVDTVEARNYILCSKYMEEI